MENLLTEFQESLRNLGVSKKDRLLLAVSGGLDSAVLAELCYTSGLKFGIAHANFQLRGAESERDEIFVCRLAGKYLVPFFTKKFDTLKFAEKEKCSVQVAARTIRYDWFKTFIGKDSQQFKYLLTAHHLDDNIETMVMHFFRGTGISGLTGMPRKSAHLVRPLLNIPRKRLEEFAASHGIEWVEDSSNASNSYTRNFFRNQLIPAATTIFPDLNHNLKNNLYRFTEAEILYHQAIALHKKKLLRQEGTEIRIPILLLKKTAPLKTILYEIIKDYHFSTAQTNEVIRLLDSVNGKYILSPSHRIIKDRRWLIIAPLKENSDIHVVVDINDSSVSYPDGKILVRQMDGLVFNSDSPAIATLDAEKIQFPLILRKWKTGDYFYPLGMKKKKKIARFLIDQKLSKTLKEKIWVLVADKQIVWVVGHRIDERFRIGNSTTKILQIRNES